MARALLAIALAGCGGDKGPSDGAGGTGDTGGGPPIDPFDYHTVQLSVELIDQDVGGQRVSFWMPDNPRAVLFAFHGSNGSITTVLNTEWLVLYNLLVPHGVGLVMTNSQDRVAQQWEVFEMDPARNPDWVYLDSVRDWLIENTALEADTPVVSAGFSNGGNFAAVFTQIAEGQGWDVRGFLAHQGGARYEFTRAPGFFVSAENDEAGQTPDHLEPFAELCSDVTDEPCPHRTGREIPLHPNRFARMPYFNQEQSRAIFDDIVEMGIVDEQGTRLVDLEDMEQVFVDMMAGLDNAFEGYVDEDLRVVWATHRFSSEHAVEEAEWLLDRL